MQKDMHYYGTYAMARAAGFAVDDAQVIATAAQFVDDNDGETVFLGFSDGKCLATQPTAHPMEDAFDNFNPMDQRRVWLPFHFLPGEYNASESAARNLICDENSANAQAMVAAAVAEAMARNPGWRERVGITAHVLADTFSHWGFAGVGSSVNRVDGASIDCGPDQVLVESLINKGLGVVARIRRFFRGPRLVEAIESAVGEAGGAVGHGAVLIMPDLPFLDWRFKYEDSDKVVERNNPQHFLAGCEALYDFFCRCNPGGTAMPFTAISPTIVEILDVRGDIDRRAKAWDDEALKMYGDQSIAVYLGDDWKEDLAAFDGGLTFAQAMAKSAFAFHKAASDHRDYVLTELLPPQGVCLA